MLSKFLVIIERTSQMNELISLAAAKRKGDAESTVVALNDDVGKELVSSGVEFKSLKDYGLSEEYLEKEGLKWLRSFPNVKVKNNKNMKEIIAYNGISLWWLVDELFYLSSYVFYQIKEIIRQIIILDRITATEYPSMIFYAQNDTAASEAIELVCKSKNIISTKAPYSFSFKQILSKKLRVMIYKHGHWLRDLYRKACWAVFNRNSKQKKISKRKRLLRFGGDNWANVHDPVTGQIRKGDLYFDSVFDLLKDDYDVVSVGIPTVSYTMRTMKEKARQQRIMYRPFECYLNMAVMLKAVKASKVLHQKYQSLTECEKFRRSLDYNNIPLYDLVGRKLSLLFSRGYLTQVIASIEMAKRMIEIENPDAILMGDGVIPQRAVIAAAKSKGIPTIASMHGYNVIPYAPRLNLTPEDVGPNEKTATSYCPVTDSFVVYGQHDKDIIIRYAHFPEQDVLIGMPRYDILARAKEIFDRDKIFGELNLDPTKRLVTWMTQSHSYSLHENERCVASVYKAMKSLEDVHLVVKLHPGEDQKGSLFKENQILEPVIIGGFGDITLKLLYASDIVISHYCTTVIEALMMDKPVVIIDFGGRPITLPYVDSKAVKSVYDDNYLGTVIKSILYDDEVKGELARAREKFIDGGHYKPDGNASQRLADEIRQMVASRENNKSEAA